MRKAKLSIVLLILLLLHTLTVAFAFQYFFRTEPKLVNSGLTIHPGPDYYYQTRFSLSQKTFTNLTESQTLQISQGKMENISVTGDLDCLLNFTSYENVIIQTGAFTGQGFAKGNWTATIGNLTTQGTWTTYALVNVAERRIYHKGAISGDMGGTSEGYVFESVNGSGVYDLYYSAWRLNQVGSDLVSAAIELNGTISYHSSTISPSTLLYIRQTALEGSAWGYYTGPLSLVVTCVRIEDENSTYYGEGFSKVSYTSGMGSGEGWIYNRLVSFGSTELNGIFSEPILGVLSSSFNDNGPSKTMAGTIRRLDIILPPAADLKVTVWGPTRVSPGQTINYIIEYRNDGLKAAEFVRIINKLPSQVKYLTSSEGGVYKALPHEVVWYMENIPPKSSGYLTIRVETLWGLLQGTSIENSILIPSEPEYEINPNLTMSLENLEFAENYIRGNVTIPEFGENGTIPLEMRFESADDYIIPTCEVTPKNDGYEYTYKFTEDCHQGQIFLILPTFFLHAATVAAIVTAPFELLVAPKLALARIRALEVYHMRGLIQEEDYNFLKNMNLQMVKDTLLNILFQKAIWMFNAVIPATLQEKLGSWLVRRGISMAYSDFSKSIDYLWWEYLNKATEYLHELKVREDLLKQWKEAGLVYDMNFQTGIVAQARDPNIKYGPNRYVLAGQSLNYTVGYENEGEGIAFGVYVTDRLDLNLNASTLIIGQNGTYDPLTRTITWLIGEVGPGENGTLKYSLDVNNDAPVDIEIINYATVYFPSVPETTKTNGVVNIVSYPHDVAALKVVPYKFFMGEGYCMPINVTIENRGVNSENFNVTIYANSTTIQTKNVTLTSGNFTTITFIWNTTGFAIGNYTIKAVAEQVLGETGLDDNTFIDGEVIISKLGDLNSDGVVNYKDASLFRQAYVGAYNYLVDFNQDGVINYKDGTLFRNYYIAG